MSRLTFRDKATDVAWQKQLRDKHLGDGVPPVPHLDLKRAVVCPVSRSVAKQIILKYEWLGTMAATRWHYGIFFGNYCAGVCCVGGTNVVAGAHFHEQFGVEQREVLILARGACVHWAPKGSNTKLVSLTCRLAKAETGAKVIAAFSDTDAGEIGTIYQACNWTYIGKGSCTHIDGEVVSPNGKVVNRRIYGKIAKQNGTNIPRARTELVARGWVLQRTNPKHKYVYVLDKSDTALVARVESMRLPYPKRDTRVRSAESGTPDNQPEGALQCDPDA